MDTESSSARISKPETHRGRSRTAPLTLGRVAMVTCDQSSFFYFRGSAQKRKKDFLIAGYRSYYFVNLNFMLKWLKFACMTRLHFALWVRSLSFWLGKMGFAARLFFLARGFFPRLKKMTVYCVGIFQLWTRNDACLDHKFFHPSCLLSNFSCASYNSVKTLLRNLILLKSLQIHFLYCRNTSSQNWLKL